MTTEKTTDRPAGSYVAVSGDRGSYRVGTVDRLGRTRSVPGDYYYKRDALRIARQLAREKELPVHDRSGEARRG